MCVQMCVHTCIHWYIQTKHERRLLYMRWIFWFLLCAWWGQTASINWNNWSIIRRNNGFTTAEELTLHSDFQVMLVLFSKINVYYVNLLWFKAMTVTMFTQHTAGVTPAVVNGNWLQMRLDPHSEGLSRKFVAHWNGDIIRWTDKSYQYITEDFLSRLWFAVYSAPVYNLSIS